ncbi:MAG: xanthine dehydrogenase family protein subunit M [Deltaproteobacteria bacterium]|nr:xanthine dehydrogenase family protein subunit M [Deltaproteobacteria bacterium]
MRLPRFQYHDPGTLEEAYELLEAANGGGQILAGGTDLLVNMKKGMLSPEHVISLSRIRRLGKIAATEGTFRIGACVTAADLNESEGVRRELQALAIGAGSLGSPLVRNLATLGGNLVSARPAADLPPSLIAYGARVVLKSRDGERIVPLEEFIQGPGETVKAPEEILSEVLVDVPPLYSGGGYVKLGVRRVLEISIVNVAAFLSLDRPDGAIQSARVVLGAVGPVPLRAPAAEGVLVGERPGEALFARAAEAAVQDARPIDDFRASAEYRREMVRVLARRALEMAFGDAKERELRRWL